MTAGSSRGRSHTGLAPAPLAKGSFIFRSDYPHLKVRKLTFLSRLQLKILTKRPPVLQIPHLQVSTNFPEGRADLRIPLQSTKASQPRLGVTPSSYGVITKASSKGTPTSSTLGSWSMISDTYKFLQRC